MRNFGLGIIVGLGVLACASQATLKIDPASVQGLQADVSSLVSMAVLNAPYSGEDIAGIYSRGERLKTRIAQAANR